MPMTVGPTAVSVLKVPHILPNEQMIDQLTIHFLRARNDGGEVLRVLYPVQTRVDQAYVIFEQAEVAASVLQKSHVLELEGQSFPLLVQAADLPEMDLPASATLDLHRFVSHSEVYEVLRRHMMEVSHLSPGQLFIEGTFLKLRAAQARLQQLLFQNLSPLPQTEEPKCQFSCKKGEAEQARHRRSFHAESLEVTQAVNREESPFSHLQSSFRHSSTGGTTSPDRCDLLYSSSKNQNDSFFFFDTHTLHYILSFGRIQLQEILKRYGVQMSITAGKDPDISTIVLSGGDRKTAKATLQDFLLQTGKSLRTQEILLSTFSHDQKVSIGKRILAHTDLFPVLVRQVGDTIELVGPSRESFELKQRLLAEEVSPLQSGRVGRALECNTGRRSLSLPRPSSHDKSKTLDPQPARANECWQSKGQESRQLNLLLPIQSQRSRGGSSGPKYNMKSDRAVAQERLTKIAQLSGESRPTVGQESAPIFTKSLFQDIEKVVKEKLPFQKKRTNNSQQ